jgi:hypothetical protein
MPSKIKIKFSWASFGILHSYIVFHAEFSMGNQWDFMVLIEVVGQTGK